MSLKRRNARINDCSPPIDLDNPPSSCADLTIWFNELTLALHHGVAQWPECPRVRSLQTILNAWGRVRTPAGNVENVLKARRIRESVDYDVSTPEPPDDPMVLPLWHAIGLGRMAHDVATAETIDAAASRSIAASVRIAVAGVATRETAETDAFKRHHGIKDIGDLVRNSEDEVAPGPEERKAASSLLSFARYMNASYQVAMHHKIIADALEKVARGEITRMMLNVPPRHGKTNLASKYFPGWYLGRYPDRQVIAVTYAQEFADSLGRDVRNLIGEPEYQRVFPGTSLSEDSKAAKRFHTQKNGVYYSVGVGGPITGKGAHLLLIDDPVKNREDADSATIRRKMKEWYASTAYTRLMPGGAICIISTRWHDDDLSGWLLKEHAHEGWTVISLPAIAEEIEEWHVGGENWRRLPGEALWPEWYPVSRLMEVQRMSSREWNALYQQRPVAKEGGKCKLAWLKNRYKRGDSMRSIRIGDRQVTMSGIVLSVDTGMKQGEDNDPTMISVWGEFDSGAAMGHALLDVFSESIGYERLKPIVLSYIEQYNPKAVLIEDAALGSALLQELQHTRIANRVALLGQKPDGSKSVRFDRVLPLIEEGRVWLPEPGSDCPWLANYEDEMVAFPHGKHDESVDVTSQYLNWFRKNDMTYDNSNQESFNDPGMAALLGRISGPWSKGGAFAATVSAGGGKLRFSR